jgi:hypothetical protein
VDEPPTFRVWGRPSLGGWLSLVNLVFWVALFLALRLTSNSWAGKEPEWLEALIPVGIFMSLPFACVFLGPGHGSGGDPMNEAIGMAIVIGLNAFAWGYGLAWLIGGVKKWRAVLRPRASTTADAAKGDG